MKAEHLKGSYSEPTTTCAYVFCVNPATIHVDVDISICEECFEREENMTHPQHISKSRLNEESGHSNGTDIPPDATCAYVVCGKPATVVEDMDTFMCNECYEREHSDEVENLPYFGSGLFESVRMGEQGNGLIIADVGYASIHFFDSLGIEPIIGIAGFKNAEHYKKWAESAISSSLNDWEPVKIALYESWMPCLNDQFPINYYNSSTAINRHKYEGEFCYKTWGTSPDSEAIITTLRDVYCLRHIAFYSKASKTSKSEYGLDYFYKAWQQSFDSLKHKS